MIKPRCIKIRIFCIFILFGVIWQAEYLNKLGFLLVDDHNALDCFERLSLIWGRNVSFLIFSPQI
ncbi:hypothetical protein QQ39_14190 [Pragia fontium]|nr:hypothetical protein QQ39_14190 [Pragia fontium]